jgi:hypothetical protein
MIVYETKLDVHRAGLSNRRHPKCSQSCTHAHTHTHAHAHTQTCTQPRELKFAPVYSCMVNVSHVCNPD